MAATSRLPAWARAKGYCRSHPAVGAYRRHTRMMLMGLTDAIVLGQYAPEELAYVLSAWLPIGVSLGFGIGILLGVQVLTSRLLGIGQEAGSGRIFRQGLWWAIVMGGVLTAALVPFAAPFFHFVFVTIAPASLKRRLPR